MKWRILSVFLACVVSCFGTIGLVTQVTNPGKVTFIDSDTNTILNTIQTGGNGASFIAITPDNTTALVVNSNVPPSVAFIDIPSQTLKAVVPYPSVAGNANGIAITPDGTTAFVVNVFGNVFVLDIPSQTFSPIPHPTSGFGSQMAIMPNGSKIFIAAATGYNVFDPVTLTSTFHAVPGSVNILTVAITPDNSKAVFGDVLGNKVYIVDTSTLAISSVPVSNGPFGIAITLDSKKAYVMQQISNTAVVIDLGTNISSPVSGTDATPAFIPGITPDGGKIYVPIQKVSPGGSLFIIDVATNSFEINTISPIPLATQVVFLSLPPRPLPPTNLCGRQKKNVFLFKTERFNIISFSPPESGPTPFSYLVFRDLQHTQLIARIPANGPLTFVDHNRRKGQCSSYFIFTMSADQKFSDPACITICD